ncbi:MAG TPA: nucleoside 2-deoxyribosyltransferase [archaeon]|nr:nucleoside 2-deoxyribosyltransferase [archaeon]
MPLKIYLAFTVVGDRSQLDTVSHLSALLQARGHKVLTSHLLSRNVRDEEALHSPEFIFERDMRWLKEADAVIADVTKTGFGVGFEAGFMMASGKKVYLLYDQSVEETVSKMAIGNTMKNCVRVPYNSMQDINAFVEKYF